MKFSIYCNMKKEYLANENTYEIRVPYSQREQILDLIPYGKRIVLESAKDEVNLQELIDFNEMCQGNFVVGVLSYRLARELRENNIKYYFNLFLTDFEDIHDYVYNHKVESVLLSDERAFNYEKIKDFGVDIRLCPHTITRTIPNFDISRNFFIRPEDIHYYDDAIIYIGGYSDPERASALYDIYLREDFQGKLFELIPGFNEKIENKLIFGDFGKRRLNCEHVCAKAPNPQDKHFSNPECNFCPIALYLAQKGEDIEDILEKK